MRKLSSIPPIVLVMGSHDDLATTGRGCIMNVIAYMQGEAPTDRPRYVCPALRKLAVFLNDRLDHDARQSALLPLVERLMNTATTDARTNAQRAQRIRAMHERLADQRMAFRTTFEPARYEPRLQPSYAVQELIGSIYSTHALPALVALLHELCHVAPIDRAEAHDESPISYIHEGDPASAWAELSVMPALLERFTVKAAPVKAIHYAAICAF